MRPSFTLRDGWIVTICLAALLLLGRLVTGSDQAPELDQVLLDGLGRLLANPIGFFLLQVYRLSGVGFTAVLVMVALVFLLLKRWWNDLKLLVMSAGGILMIVDLWLKPLFDRARPHAKLLAVDGRSFPSGHAAGSIAFYFAIVAILSLHYPHLRRPLMVGATLWVMLVWFSTLVARAHWPSDLLGGGVVGLAWLTICLAFWRPGVRP
ncbi:MAG: phosphatase PAP2 family protein [Cyanobium sp.]